MPRAKADLQKLLEPSVDQGTKVDVMGYVTSAGDPTGTLLPNFIGEECLDTVNNSWYRSHGVAAADWKKLTP